MFLSFVLHVLQPSVPMLGTSSKKDSFDELNSTYDLDSSLKVNERGVKDKCGTLIKAQLNPADLVIGVELGRGASAVGITPILFISYFTN